jgi:peptide chain release factor 3
MSSAAGSFLIPETIQREVERQRTFAIISHPDAGKTTLTEKVLLYAGAIELAGAVRGRKQQRAATSDWMDVERERGISITSAALEFEIKGCHITLLDTPGHKDFSEDTYRTLLAVDSVVMVIDASKGIEPQTRKLFEVCRQRGLPMLTFVNKLDQPSRDPLDLLDEIERVLGVAAAPMNWPIGDGDRFRGVYDLRSDEVIFYERESRGERRGERRASASVANAADPALVEMLGDDAARTLLDSVRLLETAGTTFDMDAYRAARQTPVFFGSALSNFGLEPFLQALADLAPPPAPRPSDRGPIDPLSTDFTGFVFKIQANMNPRHRDRVAFVRVCSGVLAKDMQVVNARLNSSLRLSRPNRFFGRDRETVDYAYPGDVVGLVNPGRFAIGDTLYAGPPTRFPPMPRFPAEHFGTLVLEDTRAKQFDDGVLQLEEEGLMQVLFPREGRRAPVLGVVGALQFEIVVARMAGEYGVKCRVDPLSYSTARRVVSADSAAPGPIKTPPGGYISTVDRDDRPVLLFSSNWELEYCIRENPHARFLELT